MEAVNHPRHYNASPSGVECITVVEHMSFNVGNAMKYLWRADEKGAPVQDLEKARWYVDREIERREPGKGLLPKLARAEARLAEVEKGPQPRVITVPLPAGWQLAPWKVEREEGETDEAYKARAEATGATHGLAAWGEIFQLSHKPWSAERASNATSGWVGARRGPKSDTSAARIAELIVRDVAELPDRTSPDDWPEALLVTGEELHALIVEHFSAANIADTPSDQVDASIARIEAHNRATQAERDAERTCEAMELMKRFADLLDRSTSGEWSPGRLAEVLQAGVANTNPKPRHEATYLADAELFVAVKRDLPRLIDLVRRITPA